MTNERNPILVFNEALTEVVGKHPHKVSRVYLEGKLETRKSDENATSRSSALLANAQNR